MYFSLDKDILIKDKNGSLTFVVNNISNQNDFSLVKYKNVDIHIMNKQSLLRELE